MTSPTLLLALAPAASVVANQSIGAARAAGESFASVLGSLMGSEDGGAHDLSRSAASSSSDSAVISEPKLTLSQSIRGIADQLRSWLQDHGATSDYSIDFHLSPDGASELDVSGESADQIKRLLASDMTWMTKLRQLASSMQAESVNRYQGSDVPSVTIEMDSSETRIY